VAEIAIRAQGVSKYFRGTGRATSLKERLLRMGHGTAEPFHALENVSVEIAAGHSVGLIGPNGSGKSTLLKILTGIVRPTAGTVEVNGRVSSLLELGAGFNGELSGRDNVYLNASLLGLSRRETDALFDSIVSFAELEDFIDNPVKHYSSGMYVRLGFAVAVHVDPDILLVDEVLAVGDEAFQRKCLDKIAQFQQEGRTILFVTHSLDLVEEICDRGIVLHHGKVVYDGDPLFATGALRRLLGTSPEPLFDPVDKPGTLEVAVTIGDKPGTSRRELTAGGPVGIRVDVSASADEAARIASVRAVVVGVGDIPIWIMRADRQQLPADLSGTWSLDFTVAECPPLQGAFEVVVGVENAAGDVMSVRRSRETVWVRSGTEPGILAVPYGVAGVPTPEVTVSARADTIAERGAG
jgi:ABC-2 type transport system ATP-binding protein